jgi:hypothetical protein
VKFVAPDLVQFKRDRWIYDECRSGLLAHTYAGGLHQAHAQTQLLLPENWLGLASSIRATEREGIGDVVAELWRQCKEQDLLEHVKALAPLFFDEDGALALIEEGMKLQTKRRRSAREQMGWTLPTVPSPAPADTSARRSAEPAPNGLAAPVPADEDVDLVVEAAEGEATPKSRGRPRHGKEHHAAVRQDMIDAMVDRIHKDKTKNLTYAEFVNELCSPSTGERLTSNGKWPGLAKRMGEALGVDCSFLALRAEAQEIVDAGPSVIRRARTIVFSRQDPRLG